MRGIRLSIKLPMLVVLSIFLMAIAGAVLTITIGRNALRARELAHNVESVQTYAGAISFYIANARSVLETTSGLPEIKDFASARFINPALFGLPASVDAPKRKIAALILKHSEVFEYIMLLRNEGLVYLLEPYDLQLKLSRHNLAFTAWYKKLMSTGQTIVSDLHISHATQRPTVIIATPVHDDAGKIIGIWAGALKLKKLSEIGRGELGSETPFHYGYVTDNRGLVIAHQSNLKYVEEQTDFSSVPPVRAALSGQRGATQFIDPIEREEKLGAYLPLSGSEWAVVYVVPTTIAFAPMNDLAQNLALIAAGVVVILGLVSMGVVRKITKPLEKLTVGAEKIGAGNLTQRIEVRTGDELERLADEFNRMAASLSEKEAQLNEYTQQLEQKVQERTKGLQESEERFRIGATSASDLIWDWDIPSSRLDWFGDIDEILGYQPGEFPRTIDAWGEAIHGDDVPRVNATLGRHLKEGEAYYEEYRIKCKDGTYRYWTDRGTAMRDEKGEPYRMIGACSDITERKRAEEEIHKLNAELEQRVRDRTAQLEAANKELEAFSYSVSHDLRAPLRAIDGFSRVVLEDYTGKLDDEGKRYLNIIRSNTQKMGHLIDDLLAFSRLGRQEIRASGIDMGKLAKAVSEELKLAVPERKLKFTINTLIPAQGDQAMIRQVFVNLLSNAVKFTRPKDVSTIEVGGSSGENETIYYVKDKGVGFDMQYVNKLFGVFQRLHSSEEFEGTGVGLAIVQRIIHRHGGRVWAEGKVGEGATFYFSLPAK